MKKIVWKAYYDYEKEEIWLNEMADKGFALESYSWCRYVFVACEPGQYIYRLELLDNLASHPDSQTYIKFLEESGIEYVASYLRWIYVRKDAKEGSFEIYTDNESKLKYYKKVFTFWVTFMLIEMSIGLMNIAIGLTNGFIAGIGKSISVFNLVIGICLVIIGLFLYKVGKPMKDKIKRVNRELLLRE